MSEFATREGGAGQIVIHLGNFSFMHSLYLQLEIPLQLSWSWRRVGPDMPFGMSGYIQSVVAIVYGTVYVGGGNTGTTNDYIVMKFDIFKDKWSTLPPYRASNFAMASINYQLVLVGGNEGCGKCKVLGVWDADIKQWTHSYPAMHTARSSCSTVVYNEWLVVAGGVTTSDALLSSVEVMNIESKQWYAGPQTCVPWHSMKTAIVGVKCFFMSGYTGESIASSTATTNVYSVSLPYLISKLESDERDGQVWKEISELQTTFSTPLSISAHGYFNLLAIGGIDKALKAVTAIHRYQPVTGEWVKVGDLPTPRYNCTCFPLNSNREILVVGGINAKYTKTVEMDKTKFKIS